MSTNGKLRSLSCVCCLLAMIACCGRLDAQLQVYAASPPPPANPEYRWIECEGEGCAVKSYQVTMEEDGEDDPEYPTWDDDKVDGKVRLVFWSAGKYKVHVVCEAEGEEDAAFDCWFYIYRADITTENELGFYTAVNDDRDEGNENPAGTPVLDCEAHHEGGHRCKANDDEVGEAVFHLRAADTPWKNGKWKITISDTAKLKVWDHEASGWQDEIVPTTEYEVGMTSFFTVDLEGLATGQPDLVLYVKPADEQSWSEKLVAPMIMKMPLDIYHGNDGATAVSETLEELEGAFGIANLNDTDSDTTVDKDDDDVPGEKDLVKLVIGAPTPADGEVTVTLSITGDGTAVEVWKNATKSDGKETNRTFSSGVLPKTLYLEGKSVSESVRAITVTASFPKGSFTVKDKAKATYCWADLKLYNEHGGPAIAEADEENPGTFVMINDDDDDADDAEDNDNDEIDGANDRLDMAKMLLDVQPYDASDLTVELSATNSWRVKVFDEDDDHVTLTETINMTRFAAEEALDYHIEGGTAGEIDFTLTMKKGTHALQTDGGKTTVKAWTDWKAWPGGQTDTALNPTETITSANLGLTGQVDWTLEHGGNTGATITATVPPGGTGKTATNKSQITIRYDTTSGTSKKRSCVEVKAFDQGADGKLGASRRTVFTADWKAANVSADLDGDFTRRWTDPPTGTDTDRAEFNWDGERGATRIAAKMEGVAEFAPTGIDWPARGVTWKYSDAPGGGVKYDVRLHRRRIATVVHQPAGSGARTVFYNDAGWVYDGNSDALDAQNPTVDKPNKAFRKDSPGDDADAYLQLAWRVDFREVVEWHDGTEWRTITADDDGLWHMKATAVLPTGAKGGANSHGPGATAGDIPNKKPVANAGTDQGVASQANVTLDGTASTDADNDGLTYKWTQTAGPNVTLNDDTAAQPTFQAPAGPTALTFQLKVSDICKGLHHHRPANYESDGDTVTINVAAP
ncbi:MAG: hypothetical protein AMS16_03280 [Planctomycetes bacterium DG_58]|nr:MAG: hypothetical protein AMS16_03280 [Planctomycetes bacterium DG_58]